MELIDVLDENGHPTGLRKEKREIHRDGDWHRAVHVWVIRPDGSLLIQLRAADKLNNPNMWDISAAGHVSAGEGSLVSAVREVEEEIGLKLKETELNFLGTLKQVAILNEGSYTDREFNDVYWVNFEGELSALTLQEEELQELKFIHWTELQRWVTELRSDLVWHLDEYQLLFTFMEEKATA